MTVQAPTGLSHVRTAFFVPAGDEDPPGTRGQASFLTTDAQVYLRTLTADGTWTAPRGPNPVDVSKRWTGYGQAITKSAPAIAAVAIDRVPRFVQAAGSERTVIVPNAKASGDESSKNVWFKLTPTTGRPLKDLFTGLPDKVKQLTSATSLQQASKAVVFAGRDYRLVETSSAVTDQLPDTQTPLAFAVHAALTIDNDTMLLMDDGGTWRTVTISVKSDDTSGTDWTTFTLTT
ncbi:hypothetical protein H8N00_07580 [Streptomyces sp. AC563]|uniref:hypothetical protein n=1 Tax=Streptomyces buecherae TaxID=2763006 RepID=UPI00164DAACE|nr:hypothetical protein [Streptomyces buecherae]MBC3988749.1 hypothetical protein [Streptomyces buecherae]